MLSGIRNSFASILFDLLGLAFRYQIQLVRSATTTLGTELWGTSFMQITAAVKFFFLEKLNTEHPFSRMELGTTVFLVNLALFKTLQ